MKRVSTSESPVHRDKAVFTRVYETVISKYITGHSSLIDTARYGEVGTYQDFVQRVQPEHFIVFLGSMSVEWDGLRY